MSKFHPGQEQGRRRRTLQRRQRGALTYQTSAGGDTSQSEALTVNHRYGAGNERCNLTPDLHHSFAQISSQNQLQGIGDPGTSNRYR